jgi:hypothetical protein
MFVAAARSSQTALCGRAFSSIGGNMTTRLACIALILLVAGCGSGIPTTVSNPNALDHYPLDVCVVSSQKLGSMGEPYSIKYQGKTVKLCCSKCVKEFNTDPAKFLGILDEAEKKAGPVK